MCSGGGPSTMFRGVLHSSTRMRLKRAIDGRRRLRGSPIVLGLAASILLAQCTGISHSETACQEAVALLQDCCPPFDATRVRCSPSPASTSSCAGAVVTTPAAPATLSQSDIECILQNSCNALVSHGVCSRLEARIAVRLHGGVDASGSSDSGADVGDSSGSGATEAVCF
jgi:hypothetical protein